MLRNRKPTTAFESVKQLDAFQKLPEEDLRSSCLGGTISVISRLLIAFIIYQEIKDYFDSKLLFRFTPDADLNTKLRLNLDLTVAMPCKSIGADILDSTNQNTFSFGQLEEEDVWWKLDQNQQQHFDYMNHLNRYLTEEYHSVAEVMYKTSEILDYKMPERLLKPVEPFDACRIHGSLTLNKVAGNFHVTAGKSIHFPQGHLHLNFIFDEVAQNFSHRITKLSFGDHQTGIVQPLEYEEKIFDNDKIMMMYYIEVVPTDIQTFLSHVKTFQYSVKENKRVIDHDHGSHGMPGLYFKYDMSALKVQVLIDRENLVKLTIRLCSVIAGVVVISGFINTVLQKLLDGFLKTFAPQLYAIQEQKLPMQHQQKKNYDILMNIPESQKQKATHSKPNINLLTNNLFLNTDSTTVPFSLMTNK